MSEANKGQGTVIDDLPGSLHTAGVTFTAGATGSISTVNFVLSGGSFTAPVASKSFSVGGNWAQSGLAITGQIISGGNLASSVDAGKGFSGNLAVQGDFGVIKLDGGGNAVVGMDAANYAPPGGNLTHH